MELEPDSRFELDGRNVSSRLKVTPSEAALGAELDVETLNGPVRIKLPPGSTTPSTGTPARASTSGRALAVAVLQAMTTALTPFPSRKSVASMA